MARVPDPSKPLELVIDIGDDPNPVLILKGPTDEALDKFERNVTKTVSKRHNKEETVVNYDMMKAFIDDHLVGCEDIEVVIDGEYVALDPEVHEDWKSRIPVTWKYTAASHFCSGSGGVHAREQEAKNS